jgi:hypothetical protein
MLSLKQIKLGAGVHVVSELCTADTHPVVKYRCVLQKRSLKTSDRRVLAD